jgi:N-acetylneuraminic acid mutarotase
MGDQWLTIGTSPLAEARAEHQGVWTGAQLLIWGGTCGERQDRACRGGAAYSPSDGQWASLGNTDAEPTSRKRHSTVWSGAQMLVWGGEDAARNALNDGAGYALDTHAWSPIAASGAPTSRRHHSATWTGTEMVIWGGDDRPATFHALGDGGRYDPVMNRWQALPAQGAPSPRYLHTAIWTGSEMIVWGGLGCGVAGGSPLPCGDGARYNPLTDSWRPMSNTNAPQARAGHSTVWTGKEMIVWGGAGGGGFFGNGALYRPETDDWRPMTDIGAPSPRNIHRGVWTGDRMLVWGGLGGGGGESAVNDGGQFFPDK